MRYLGWALFAVISAASGAAAWLWHLHPAKEPADAAAWAQAVTAAAVAIVTLGVVLWQHALQAVREDLRERRTKADKAEAAVQLAAAADGVVTKVRAHLQVQNPPNTEDLRRAHAEVQTVLAALDKYRVEDFPTYLELQPLVNVMSLSRVLEKLLADSVVKNPTVLIHAWLANELQDLGPRFKSEIPKLKGLADVARTKASR